MTFQEFSDYLSSLSKTTLRNEITKILSSLFKKSNPDEIDKICYLLLGRLAPKFVPLEFQFAQKNMIKGIAKATNESEEKVRKEFKKRGDMGNTIFEIKNQRSIRQLADKMKIQNLKIVEVYEKLLAIAQEEGAGSVERKINGMVELLKELDGTSAKYLVRMVLGTLRLGFSDMTILDALSWMEKGNKSLRPILEEGYNNSTDIGLIARSFKEGGVSKIKKIGAKVGIPIRPQQAERLPTSEEILEKLGECAIEYKLDGLRCQVHIINSEFRIYNSEFKKFQKRQKQLTLENKKEEKIVRLFSRNLEDTTHMFPEIVEAAKKLKVEDAIFDGEAIGIDVKTGKFLPFQETAQRKRKHGIEEMAKKVPLKYFAFDLLYLNGESLLNKPFRERRGLLEKALE